MRALYELHRTARSISLFVPNGRNRRNDENHELKVFGHFLDSELEWMLIWFKKQFFHWFLSKYYQFYDFRSLDVQLNSAFHFADGLFSSFLRFRPQSCWLCSAEKTILWHKIFLQCQHGGLLWPNYRKSSISNENLSLW